ncbi:MAG: hydrogenase maturation protease [Streptosporangiaceae bacterium]
MSDPAGVVVIGVGNEFRGDDGAGPEVVARLRGRVPSGVRLMLTDGEPASLLEAWSGTAVAIVADAVAGGAAPAGTLRRLVLDAAATVAGLTDRDAAVSSSHGLGLETAIGLAIALGRLPALLIVHGIQGADFSQRHGLSEPVAAAIGDLAEAILADVALAAS